MLINILYFFILYSLFQGVNADCYNNSFTNLSGNIRFPLNGSKYSNNVQCWWSINVAPNILKVELNNTYMECGYDYVAFYYDPAYKNESGRYCSDSYAVTFRESGVLYIRVRTDGSVVRSGFNLTWSSITKDSISENQMPTFVWGNLNRFEPIIPWLISTDSSCVQTCWTKIETGTLYVGTLRDTDSLHCYCIITYTGYPLMSAATWKIQYFLFSMFQSESPRCSIGSNIIFQVKVSFYLEGNDKSTVYFIDDLGDPINRSGRINITSFINLKRGYHQSITTERHNESKLYNLVKETYSGNLNTKFENFYSLNAKILDMSVANNHTEWAVMVYENINFLLVALKPFVITRPLKNCNLNMVVSNFTINQSIYINFNMTTSVDCNIDLENVTILMQHHRKFKLIGFIWDDSSIKATLFMNRTNFNLIYLNKIYIDSFVNFTAIYVTDVSLAIVGKEFISVVASITSTQFSSEIPNVINKQYIFTAVLEQEEPIKATSQISFSLTIKNYTKFENKTHTFVCMLMKSRQQSPCFQQEISSGIVIFLPIQVSEVIGYDPITNLLYGKTLRNHVVQLNIYSKNVFIITRDKWLTVSNSLNFQKK